LEQKAQLITQRLKHCNSNWEDAFFITLARNFGFGLNGDAFETWAGLLPFRAMDKHRNDLFQIEAFFYGLAGLLKETFLKKEQEDEYSLRLCKEFRYLQRKFEIGQGMDGVFYGFVRKTFRIFVWRSWLISIRKGISCFHVCWKRKLWQM